MTTTNRFIAKTAAVVAGFALVVSSFVAFAPSARAATIEELQAQVNALLAQLAALTGGSSASMTFTRDLTIGATGAEVSALQNFLISKGYSIPAGATGYFGTQTQSALAAFQAANAIAPAAGYFGPITRAKVNSISGTATPVPGSSDDTSGLGRGEASLDRLRVSDGEDSEVEEGGVAEVAEIEFRVKDGDVRVNRLDLTFDPASGNDEDEPWKAFDTVRLYANGKEIAEEDVSDEDDWLDDDEPYVFRFSDIDYVVRKGDTAKIVVEVEAQDGVVDAGSDEWTIYVDDDGIRATDGEGISQYIGNDDETATFDLVEEGEGEELRVRSSSEDPDATTLQVEDDKRSDWYTVFVFDLEAKDNDLDLETLPIDFTTGTADVDDVIQDVELVIDGDTFDDFEWTGSGTFASTTFDIDGDYTVDEGDRVEVEVRVRFNAANGVNYSPGETIQASVRGEHIKAEGADDLNGEGNATGETHTLEISGIRVTRVDESATATSVEGSDNDYAVYTIEANITAFEQDVFISTIGTTAFTYRIENASDGTELFTSTATSSTVSSTASQTGDYYRVSEGQTKKFIFRVVLNPLAVDEGQNYRLQLLTIAFADSPSTPDQTWTAAPENHYETSSAYIAD